jgi:hypothetical protein
MQYAPKHPADVKTQPCDGYVTTVNCPCGWEALYLLPEECFEYLIGVLAHAKSHGAAFPAMEHRTH